MDRLLSMKSIRKSFFGVAVLKDVNYDLQRGEVHVLLGENGAGKSTLIKILSGAYTADSGTIELEGVPIDLSDYDPRKAEKLGIVTIYQNFHLIPHLTVAENIALPNYGGSHGLIDWKKVNQHAHAVLDTFGFDINPNDVVRNLPVSKKQMLEIAIALSKQAKILIMDEPTAALSAKETEVLFEMISSILSQGIGIIYISHKLEEIRRIGDRVTVLRDGNAIATVDPKKTETNALIELMIGKSISTQYSKSYKSGTMIFSAKGIVSPHLPEPVNFEVKQNEILGITGLVGSSKTELARAIFGADPIVAGKINFNGKPLTIHSPHDSVRHGIGYLPEDRDAHGLCLNMGVTENLSLAFLAKLRTLFFSRINERTIVGELIKDIDIRTTDISQQVKYLSGGNKQKVVFGKWLCVNCHLLILDEPTIGIDVGARSEIYELIRNYVATENRSVIFISSDIDEILQIANRILVMADGKIVAELDPSNTTKQEIMHFCVTTE